MLLTGLGGGRVSGSLAAAPHALVRPATGNLSAAIVTYPSSGFAVAPINVSIFANISGGVAPYGINWTIQPGNITDNCLSTICDGFFAPLNASGWYNVTQCVVDANGTRTVVSMAYLVLAPNGTPLTANLSVAPVLGSPPLTVYAAAEIMGGTGPYNYTFSLGNWSASGQAPNGRTPTYHTVLATTGDYLLNFTATDANGTSVARQEQVFVYPPVHVWVNLSANVTQGYAPLAVNFSVNASATANVTVEAPFTWLIDYGFGNVSAGNSSSGWNGTSGTYVYELPGTYLVQVSVPYQFIFENSTIASWSTASLTITVLGNSTGSGGSGNQSGKPHCPTGNSSNPPPGCPPPLSAAGSLLSVSGTSGIKATFEIEVTGGTLPYSIQVAYGDGTFGSALPGVPFGHGYAAPGVYHPTATVRDGSGLVRVLNLPTVHVPFPATGLLGMGRIGSVAIYAGAALVLGAIAAAVVLIRRQKQRESRARAEGEALVRALHGSGPRR